MAVQRHPSFSHLLEEKLSIPCQKSSDGNLGRVLDGDAARKSGEVKVNLLSSSKAYGFGQSGAIDFSASLLMVARLDCRQGLNSGTCLIKVRWTFSKCLLRSHSSIETPKKRSATLDLKLFEAF
jgi:hypothetical protein